MADKKLTDEEIKSSLEVIATTQNCNDCKIRNCKWGTCNCSQITANTALDLINRQQEQLEAAANGQETLQKALAEKNAEIERRKNNLFCKVVIDEEKMRNIINEKVTEFELNIELIKAEAIKEFAERLKQRCSANSDINYYILKKRVDNLVKKMTEVDE